MGAPGAGQAGFALVVGLILLLVVTMLGLAAMQVTTQQERMAGNLRDRNIALQAAETALRQGEAALMNRCINTFSGSGAYDVEGNSSAQRLFVEGAASVAWTDLNSFSFDDFDAACSAPAENADLFQSSDPPRYFVERQPPISGPSLEVGVAKTIEVFKVTSRGVGGSDAAVVVLQSSFRRD
jgi:type IV pilus assembly protein PilX